jgi:hypothetical protein
MRGMKSYNLPACPAPGKEPIQALESKNTFYEIFS